MLMRSKSRREPPPVSTSRHAIRYSESRSRRRSPNMPSYSDATARENDSKLVGLPSSMPSIDTRAGIPWVSSYTSTSLEMPSTLDQSENSLGRTASAWGPILYASPNPLANCLLLGLHATMNSKPLPWSSRIRPTTPSMAVAPSTGRLSMATSGCMRGSRCVSRSRSVSYSCAPSSPDASSMRATPRSGSACTAATRCANSVVLPKPSGAIRIVALTSWARS